MNNVGLKENYKSCLGSAKKVSASLCLYLIKNVLSSASV